MDNKCAAFGCATGSRNEKKKKKNSQNDISTWRTLPSISPRKSGIYLTSRLNLSIGVNGGPQASLYCVKNISS